jgi:hypothetical protein
MDHCGEYIRTVHCHHGTRTDANLLDRDSPPPPPLLPAAAIDDAVMPAPPPRPILSILLVLGNSFAATVARTI